MKNQYLSIGHLHDGAFHILATLNNHDELADEPAWVLTIATVVNILEDATSTEMTVIERWDTPDYVYLDEDE
ncbi:MAG TPA: hypothetical protein VGP68_06080 [Gemmataceae bacterium]|jgi:hypothetical protein|nr:hypothetical protein [Gemmataceae bacterium]